MGLFQHLNCNDKNNDDFFHPRENKLIEHERTHTNNVQVKNAKYLI